ncbi:MAG TPA: hypothetical protein VMI56_23570 [Reyranella sp.]|nr:hypothetical protein [Reyranella sp.]
MEKSSPLFSVVRCAQGGAKSADQQLAGLRSQTCQDFEIITAEGGGEQLLAALRRCRGRYVAVCPPDGNFLPDALAFAADELGKQRDIGGLCCRGFFIDAEGEPIADPVDIVSLLVFGHRLHLPSGFFVRQALLDCGLERDIWHVDALDLDLWSRIATDFGILSVERSATAGETNRSVPSHDIEKTIAARLAVLDRLLSRDGFFQSANSALLLEARLNHLASLRSQTTAEGPLAAHLQRIVDDLMALLPTDHRVLSTLHRLTLNRTHALGLFGWPVAAWLDLIGRDRASRPNNWKSPRLRALVRWLRVRLPIHAGYTTWNFPRLGAWLRRRMFVEAIPASRPRDAQFRLAKFADVYALAGEMYETRGQIGMTLAVWDRVWPRNMRIDSLVSQALLKLPGLSEKALGAAQRERMAPHVRQSSRPFAGKARTQGKIRVGYHCAFMNLDTIRFQLRNSIAARDRDRFEIYGYSPQKWLESRTPDFDRFRHVPPLDELVGDAPEGSDRRLDDDAYVDVVRSDRLDILVELTGFSPGNRFAAMAQRCAPIQVNYVNHLGTCGLPNIDYVIADEVAAPSSADSQRHYYSEQIYRLPGCFFCFDYRNLNEVPVAEPPFTNRGYVTFGYFGTGAKINIEVVALWAKLLHRVPNAKLYMRNMQLIPADNKRFMIDRFGRYGIPADRLIIADGGTRPQIVKSYDDVDISLDPTPYCGGNTIAESCWQGVPAITLRGDRFISAYGSSLMTAVGCPDLAAGSADDYVEIAARLANDPERLRTLRYDLRRRYTEGRLNDAEGLERRLEAAYTDMVGRLAGSSR